MFGARRILVFLVSAWLVLGAQTAVIRGTASSGEQVQPLTPKTTSSGEQAHPLALTKDGLDEPKLVDGKLLAIEPNSSVKKLTKLESLSLELDTIRKLKPTYKTLKDLSTIYDRVVKVLDGETLYNNAMTTVTTAILTTTADLLGNVSSHIFDAFDNRQGTFVTQFQVTNEVSKGNYTYRGNFLGSSIYLSETFEISVMCLVDEATHVGLTVYAENGVPLRPLPHTPYPMHKFQAFDLIVAKESWARPLDYGDFCDSYEYLDTLIFRWLPERSFKFAKYFCLQWSDDQGGWTSEGCTLATSWDIPANVSCFCDVRNNTKTVAYLMYSLEEDVTVHSESVDYEYVSPDDYYVLANVSAAEDVAFLEYMTFVESIARDVENITELQFYVFLTNYLMDVISMPSAVLFANCTEAFLDDIGTILANAHPDDGSFIGIRTVEASGFVMKIDEYSRDPLIGFALYRRNGGQAMYYRLRDEIDLNILFSTSMEFSLMFSDSVISQNARYAFLVYPTDRYFRPATCVGKHRVVAMRVVDVVLTPQPHVEDSVDQSVHLFQGLHQYEFDDTVKFGCAFWSAKLGNWTTAGCRPDPELYRGVCTCVMSAHFGESRVRGQYIYFEYRVDDFNTFKGETHFDYTDTEFIEAGIHSIRELRLNYHYGGTVIDKMLHLLFDLFHSVDGTYRLFDSQKDRVIEDARQIVINNYCLPEQIYNTFGCVCYNRSNSANFSKQIVAFSYNKSATNFHLNTFTPLSVNASHLYNAVDFAVRISDSVAQQNARYAFLIYKANLFLKPPPVVDGLICTSHVIDVVLAPKDDFDSTVAQSVEIFMDQSLYNDTRLGCAIWSRRLQDWTTFGCSSRLVADVEVCNCSLAPTNFKTARDGGQFMVYAMTRVRFDDDVYLALGEDAVTDGDAILERGGALIRNASMIPVDNDLVVKILSVYNKLLTHAKEEMIDNDAADRILHDLDVTFSRHCRDPIRNYCHTSGIKGSWSVNKADVTSDLFSNAVLTANDTEAPVLTDMALAVLGYTTHRELALTAGIHFAPNESNVVRFERHRNDGVRAGDTLFACYLVEAENYSYYRLIFVVYPLNLSPFPYTMTTGPVFNSRQIDVYVDVEENALKSMVLKSPKSLEMHLEVHFKPTANPKGYVNISCAFWNETQSGWSTEGCSMTATDPSHCICDITGRRVTRIIMYEYTDMQNFSFLETLKAPSILYLVVSTLSLFGFCVIFATVCLFDKWREELGNKILIQLTASSFLYLCLTMYRESHLIFADNNHKNVWLIVFTVLVHYTRLVHYCWGLVMSVLQYKKFSGVVGASAISHLLLKVSLAAWATPLAPLLVLLSWDQTTHFCGADKLTHYVLYLVPGAIITVASCGLLVAIVLAITSCFGFRAVKDLQRHGVDNAEVLKRNLLQTFMMFFLFGIPTIFEMFNDLISHSEVADYIGKILDPIQGFIMFLFFIVFDKKTNTFWQVLIYGQQAATTKAARKDYGGQNGKRNAMKGKKGSRKSIKGQNSVKGQSGSKMSVKRPTVRRGVSKMSTVRRVPPKRIVEDKDPAVIGNSVVVLVDEPIADQVENNQDVFAGEEVNEELSVGRVEIDDGHKAVVEIKNAGSGGGEYNDVTKVTENQSSVTTNCKKTVIVVKNDGIEEKTNSCAIIGASLTEDVSTIEVDNRPAVEISGVVQDSVKKTDGKAASVTSDPAKITAEKFSKFDNENVGTSLNDKSDVETLDNASINSYVTTTATKLSSHLREKGLPSEEKEPTNKANSELVKENPHHDQAKIGTGRERKLKSVSKTADQGANDKSVKSEVNARFGLPIRGKVTEQSDLAKKAEKASPQSLGFGQTDFGKVGISRSQYPAPETVAKGASSVSVTKAAFPKQASSLNEKLLPVKRVTREDDVPTRMKEQVEVVANGVGGWTVVKKSVPHVRK